MKIDAAALVVLYVELNHLSLGVIRRIRLDPLEVLVHVPEEVSELSVGDLNLAPFVLDRLRALL